MAVVLRALGLREGVKVLELAAGTGHMTRLLKVMDADVVATEPDPEMRAAFVKLIPDIEMRAGTSTQIPADDCSYDFVIAADAFHWFPPDATRQEILRVLKPGGIVICVEGARDPKSDWERDLENTLTTFRASITEPDWGVDPWKATVDNEAFDAHAIFEFHHSEQYDIRRMMALVRSYHFVEALAPDQKAAVLTEVERLAKRYLANNTDGFLPMNVWTVLACARKV